MAEWSKDAEKWIFLRQQVEVEWLQAKQQLETQAEYEKRFGYEPKRGWSKPYRGSPGSKLDLPHMSNKWWTNFSELVTRRAKLDARPLDTEYLFRDYLSNAIRPLSPMEWKSFTFDAETSELSRWEKGKLTRTFKGVVSGRYPLRRLTDLFEEYDMDFDYEEFRRSYRK